MKKEIHRAAERGKGEYEWLSTRYSFSFADWHDPLRMGFGALRVLNDDRVAPRSGFPPHSHKDAEIVTIVTKGVVTHEDDLGHAREVSAGEVQVMSAGTGVTHAEWNRGDEPLELFQLWFHPAKVGVAPRYAERHFPDTENQFRLLVSGDEALKERPDGTLFIHQSVYLYLGNFFEEYEHTHRFGTETPEKRGAYLFVVEGKVKVDGDTLGRRDAIALYETPEFQFKVLAPSKVLLIDVPLV